MDRVCGEVALKEKRLLYDDDLFLFYTDDAAGQLAVSVCGGPCLGRGGEYGKFKTEHDERIWYNTLK